MLGKVIKFGGHTFNGLEVIEHLSFKGPQKPSSGLNRVKTV